MSDDTTDAVAEAKRGILDLIERGNQLEVNLLFANRRIDDLEAKLSAVTRERDAALRAVEAVRELHRSEKSLGKGPFCVLCCVESTGRLSDDCWNGKHGHGPEKPICATIAALDGVEAVQALLESDK